MTDRRPHLDRSDWGWVKSPGTELCGCLTFVRAVTPERVMEGFGTPPAAARPLPRDRAHEAALVPVLDEQGDVTCPVIRVGRTGDWAFAFEDPVLEAMTIEGLVRGVGRRLSAGTEAVVVSWTPTIDTVQYLADGQIVLSFEPLRAWDRAGTQPDRFLAEMRRAGLETTIPEEPGLSPERAGRLRRRDPLVAALDMLTLALGIRLTRDMIEGPLLTVQRPPGTWLPGW